MRTTLTLEPDVADLVKEAIEREHSTLKDVVNEALRRGLRPTGPHQGLRVVPHSSALMPGLDPRGFNKLADELEDDALIARMFPQTR
jgi:hypothetical protein